MKKGMFKPYPNRAKILIGYASARSVTTDKALHYPYYIDDNIMNK